MLSSAAKTTTTFFVVFFFRCSVFVIILLSDCVREKYASADNRTDKTQRRTDKRGTQIKAVTNLFCERLFSIIACLSLCPSIRLPVVGVVAVWDGDTLIKRTTAASDERARRVWISDTNTHTAVVAVRHPHGRSFCLLLLLLPLWPPVAAHFLLVFRLIVFRI